MTPDTTTVTNYCYHYILLVLTTDYYYYYRRCCYCRYLYLYLTRRDAYYHYHYYYYYRYLYLYLTRRDAWSASFDHLFDQLPAPRTDAPMHLPEAPPPTARHAACVRSSSSKEPSLAAPQLGPCASPGRARRLQAARHSQGEARPLGAAPPPRGLKRSRLQGRWFPRRLTIL